MSKSLSAIHIRAPKMLVQAVTDTGEVRFRYFRRHPPGLYGSLIAGRRHAGSPERAWTAVSVEWNQPAPLLSARLTFSILNHAHGPYSFLSCLIELINCRFGVRNYI